MEALSLSNRTTNFFFWSLGAGQWKPAPDAPEMLFGIFCDPILGVVGINVWFRDLAVKYFETACHYLEHRLGETAWVCFFRMELAFRGDSLRAIGDSSLWSKLPHSQERGAVAFGPEHV